jgi:5-hydroxyisourate hydrolase
MSQVSAVTTHVLDTAKGTPAVGVAVRLERVSGGAEAGGGTGAGAGAGTSGGGTSGGGEIARGQTDADGRVGDLGPAELPPGTYRLVFGTGDYFAGQGQAAFFPEVTVVFVLADPASHYHLPLLLSPFAYSTYRGS